MELRLEKELKLWRTQLPKPMCFPESPDAFFETMEEDLRRWQRMMSIFFMYHGTICLLMRRRSMLFLRELSSRLSQHYLNISSSINLPLPIIHHENEMAFKTALHSAKAIISLIRLLRTTNAFIHKLPHFIGFFVQQGALTLLLSDGLPIVGISRHTSIASTPQLNFDSGALPAHSGAFSLEGSPIDFSLNKRASYISIDEPEDDIGEVMHFLKVMSTTKKFATVMWKFFERIRTETSAVDYDSVVETTFPNSVSWMHRKVVFEDHIRDFIATFKEAKGITESLTPLLIASTMKLSLNSTPMQASTDSMISSALSNAIAAPLTPSKPEGTGIVPVDLAAAWGDDSPPPLGGPNESDDAMILLDWLLSADTSEGSSPPTAADSG
ncbi:hypothetical protein HK405_005715 [Cladochytrium tenue]|nr:hypothetical protein HK405_005715 [Cladochytrium tenue]